MWTKLYLQVENTEWQIKLWTKSKVWESEALRLAFIHEHCGVGLRAWCDGEVKPVYSVSATRGNRYQVARQSEPPALAMVSRRSAEGWLRTLKCQQLNYPQVQPIHGDTQRLRPEVESPELTRTMTMRASWRGCLWSSSSCWSHISTRCYVRVHIIDGHNTMMSPAGLWSLRLSVFSTVILGFWNWRRDSEM